jgi:hypothetical protein
VLVFLRDRDDLHVGAVVRLHELLGDGRVDRGLLGLARDLQLDVRDAADVVFGRVRRVRARRGDERE